MELKDYIQLNTHTYLSLHVSTCHYYSQVTHNCNSLFSIQRI